MTPEERLDELERRLDQLETANEIMFGLLFMIVSDQRLARRGQDARGHGRIPAHRRRHARRSGKPHRRSDPRPGRGEAGGRLA